MALDAIHNEELDKLNDQIYYDTKGMASNFNSPSGPAGEMLPGERPVREFVVDTRVKDRRPKCIRVLLYVITLGMYWVWLHFCSCCRSKSMGNNRTRVVVTNQGRVLLWRHISDGHRSPNLLCCKGATVAMNTTEFRWFHLHDVNTVQTVSERNRRCPCSAACGFDNENMFLLAVGSNYPSKDLLHTSIFTNSSVTTDSEVDWASAMQLINATSAGSRKTTMCGVDVTGATQGMGSTGTFSGDDGVDPFGTSLILEVRSSSKRVGDQAINLGRLLCPWIQETWYDVAHQQEDAAFDDARGLVTFLLENKVAHDWTGAHPPPPQLDHFRVYDASASTHEPLVDELTVKIHPGVIGLLSDERVIDAFPVFKRRTCMAFFTGPCTGNWWCFDRQLKADGAVILTNKRVITASQLNFPYMGERGWNVTAYFLGKIKTGYTIEYVYGSCKVPEARGSVGTSYGGLNISLPTPASRGCMGGKKLDGRAASLWKSLSYGAVDSVIPANVMSVVDQAYANGPDAQEAVRRLPALLQGEVVLSALRSENMWSLGGWFPSPCSALACGHYTGTAAVVKCCTCGARPFKQDNFIVVTNMRVFTIGNVSNFGFCGFMCKKKPTVTAWSALDQMTSARLLATYNIPQPVTPVQNCLAKTCCPCCNPAYADLDVRLGMIRSYVSHPFLIRKYQDRAKAGLAESPDIMNFRKALGAVTTGRTAQAAYEIMADKQYSAYVAAAGAEAGAAGGAGMAKGNPVQVAAYKK